MTHAEGERKAGEEAAPIRLAREKIDIVFAAAACAMALASLAAAPGLSGLFGAALALLMIAIARIDARAFTIPDPLSGAAFLLGLAEAARQSSEGPLAGAALAASGAFVAFLAFFALREIYWRLRGREGLGLGDVKLAGAAGAWLDPVFIAAAVEIAAVGALAAYTVARLSAGRPLRASARLPFGLFFAPAIWLCWLLQAWFGAV